ncbi:hypothetical protein [Undibacterium terreum]|uniref:Peptidase inhibitor family I36 n=1 Tax=Undibacterium terreum TaxID=1224302 RepID=A0A916UWS2_9BURK|nr:hypothetical protein [Undibacterium terreum]GGC91498.1 hypothetical protein GCM10011396_43470 [Undibacterium terreum]
MKPGLVLLASLISLSLSAGAANAVPAAPASGQAEAPNVFKNIDRCTSAGCVITCKNNLGAWERIDQAAESVTTINYPNGNVRFLLDDGVKGKRTLVYGPNNLACTITGHQ